MDRSLLIAIVQFSYLSNPILAQITAYKNKVILPKNYYEDSQMVAAMITWNWAPRNI